MMLKFNTFIDPPVLTSGAGTATSWLSENAELSLLYGSLVEAYTFMKERARHDGSIQSTLSRSLVGLKMLGEAKETTQEYRVGKVIRNKQ